MIRSIAIAVLCVACAKTTPVGAGIGEPCVTNGDCAAGFLCSSARCSLPSNLGGCEPNASRCNGADVEKCSESGLGWDHVSTCATGCTAGACRPQVCAPGAARCEGDAAEACTPSGDAWTLVQQCATHCNPDTGHCKNPSCAPFSARCDPSGANNIQVCDAYGGGYVTTACAATEECSNGICVSSSAGCTLNDLRCNGRDAQTCVAGAPGTTKWQTRETCLNACNGGLCDGAGACAGVTLHAAVATGPADGKSTVLFYSDTIKSAGGIDLPDGQEFTVSVSSAGAQTDAAIASADADASLPGIQVVSAGGRVHFVVLAPLANTADVPVTATARLAAGATCGSTAQLTFTAAASQGALVAEDFTARNSTIAGGADWNTQRQALFAGFPLPVGDGRDGALNVSAGTSLDLSTTPLAGAYRVLQLTASTAKLDVTGAALAGGDEVILWDAQGTASAAANAGSYEFLTVQGVTGDTVTFASNVRGFYGATSDQNTSLQRVVLQRVPHLTALTVPATATLTTSAWDGSKGGLIFLRVSGAAVVQGDIDMNGKGFRSATTTGTIGEGFMGSVAGGGGGQGAGGGGYGTAGTGGVPGASYGTSTLGLLHLGAGGGCTASCTVENGRGGGAIVLIAGSLSLQSASGPAWVGRIHANGATGGSSAGGAGGSVWVAAGSMSFGDPGAAGLLGASGAGNGGAGRIRLDVITKSATGVAIGCSAATPSTVCTAGVSGPLAAQSPDEFAIDAAAAVNIQKAKLELALGAPAGADYFVSASEPANFSTAIHEGDTYTFGSGAPTVGKHFRWRAELSPAPGTTQTLLGLQWSLQIY